MAQPKPISRLRDTVAAQIRSPQIVSTLAHVLEELVANSIDAQARRIEVEVDPANLSMRVSDDGCGIREPCFGSLAMRHATSKHQHGASVDQSAQSFGFKGEALASIAEISVIEVTSKAVGAFETHSKLLRGGQVVKQGLAAKQRHRTGTVVWLQDFMYNQPVRRRQLLQSGYALV